MNAGHLAGTASPGSDPGVKPYAATAKPPAPTRIALLSLRQRMAPRERLHVSAPRWKLCRTGVAASHHGSSRTTFAPPVERSATEPSDARLEQTSAAPSTRHAAAASGVRNRVEVDAAPAR